MIAAAVQCATKGDIDALRVALVLFIGYCTVTLVLLLAMLTRRSRA